MAAPRPVSITRSARRRGDGDLARPVSLDRGGADDQPGSAGREVPQRDDRLARLAEAHVVGEDRAPPAEQERDAFDLMREEPVGERDRASKRRVRIARRRAPAVGERVGLSVNGSIGQLNVPFLHLFHEVIAAAHGQRHDRQRRILAAA